MNPLKLQELDVILCHGDIPALWSVHPKIISWDIETSGLNWKSDMIATCQIYIPDTAIYIVRIEDSVPNNLRGLLEDRKVCKIFHHAAFDLRFMAYHWRVRPINVVCTKISSKILNPDNKSHSLQDMLYRYLGIKIEKAEQKSDWFAVELSEKQLRYAAIDVLHLPKLFQNLKHELLKSGRWELADASFRYLPTRVQLDIIGSGDVYGY